jgi:hypothetical protein
MSDTDIRRQDSWTLDSNVDLDWRTGRDRADSESGGYEGGGPGEIVGVGSGIVSQ